MGRNKFLLLAVIFLLSRSSFAIERYAIGAFEGRGYQCRQAVFNAQAACVREMERFTSSHMVTEPPTCGQEYCFCYGGTPGPYAVCPGKARYEDGLSYEKTPKSDFAYFRGFGYTCWQAKYDAMVKMYRSASQASRNSAVTKFQLDDAWSCQCDGYRSAVCTASVTYHQFGSVPVPDPEPQPDPNLPPAPAPQPQPPVDPGPEPEPGPPSAS